MPGSGGSAAASGGATGTGGTAVSSGGATGTGGAATGTGGSATGTGGRGSGGAVTTGGSTGTGGRGTGGATATGGAPGAGGAGARFSFFVTSVGALRRLSGNTEGFGGDLRFGETGDGAGLKGADKICTSIAETAMPGAGSKTWRAFLSAPAAAAGGTVVNAMDRIGNGPWYDRLGRLFSASKANLLGFRPVDTDPLIKNDFPNEDGVPNHTDGAPGCTGNNCPDNHDTLTGSDAMGMLYTATANPTCTGWTTIVGSAGKPRVGHSWPRSAGGGTMGGGANGGYGHWISSLDEAGCAPGVRLVEMGPPIASDPTVGSGGGYGGFYCFALTP